MSRSGGPPTSAAYTAFHMAQGAICRNSSALAQVTGARLTHANGTEVVRAIRADRKVEGLMGMDARHAEGPP